MANLAGAVVAGVLAAPVAMAENWFDLAESCEPVARMHFPGCAVWEFSQCGSGQDVAWVQRLFVQGEVFSVMDHDADGNVLTMPRMGDWSSGDMAIDHADRFDFALFLETGEEEISQSFGDTEIEASLTWDQGYRFQTDLPVNRADYIGSMTVDGEVISFDDSAYFVTDIPIFVARGVPPILLERADAGDDLTVGPECIES